MYSGCRYCEKLLKFATDTPKTNNDLNPADTTLPPPLLFDYLHLADPVIFHLKTLIVPLPWVIAKAKFAEVVILSRVFIDMVFAHCFLVPIYTDWRKKRLNLRRVGENPGNEVVYWALLITNWKQYFYVSNWRRDSHFTWSSEPRESLAACSARGVPSFLSYSKTLSIGLARVTEPTISRTAVMRSKPTKIILPRLSCFNLCF